MAWGKFTVEFVPFALVLLLSNCRRGDGQHEELNEKKDPPGNNNSVQLCENNGLKEGAFASAGFSGTMIAFCRIRRAIRGSRDSF